MGVMNWRKVLMIWSWWCGMSNETLLVGFLEIAVPMQIAKLKREGGISEERIAQLQAYGEDLSGHGEALLYRSRAGGESAARFKQFVEIIAVGAFAPGGITIFGLHFEEKSDGLGA